MKTRVLLSILISFLLISNLAAQEKSRYSIYKSGYIEYELSGSTSGTRKVWWDDFGDKSRTETNTITISKFMGIKDTLIDNSITVMLKEEIWVADLHEYKGTKQIDDLVYEKTHGLYDGMTDEEIQAFNKKVIEDFGGRYIGKENIMGHECDVIKHPICKMWSHFGVVLCWELKHMGVKHKETAIVFNMSEPIPATLFEPYEGVEYEDLKTLKEEINEIGNLLKEGFKETLEYAD